MMMFNFNWKTIGTLCLCTLVLWACVKKTDKEDLLLPEDKDTGEKVVTRQAILENVADNIIIPSYARFRLKLDTLQAKSIAFTSNPDSISLVTFRQSWVNAYIEWQKVELFDLGPANEYTMRFYYNIYPANTAGIEENIASGTANLGTAAANAKQGFPALDYLINGLGTNAETIERYKTASDAAKRIAYVKLIIDKMTSMTATVQSEWTNGYRDKFVSNTSTDAGSSMSALVNAYILNYERYVRSGKFGIPSGIMVGDGSVHPEKVEAYYKKDISLILAKTAHQASIDFFNGKKTTTGIEGASFKSYLNQLGAKDSKTGSPLSDIVNTQFTEANNKINALPNNLYEVVNTNNQAMIDTYNAIQSAVRMLKVDMTSAMSISITYTDTDGD
jgi:predicted lipoprotein